MQFLRNILVVKSNLVIHRYLVCEFAYSLKFICNPEIDTHSTSMIIHGLAQDSRKSELPDAHVPSEVKQGNTLLFCFNSFIVSNCPLGDLFGVIFFSPCLCFCW